MKIEKIGGEDLPTPPIIRKDGTSFFKDAHVEQMEERSFGALVDSKRIKILEPRNNSIAD